MGNPFRIRQDPENPVPKEVFGWRVYAVSFAAAWASAMFGYDSAFIGGTLSLQSFQDTFGLNKETKTQLSSNIVSTFQAGAFFGAIFAFPISEGFGRRINLITCGLAFAVGAALQVSSSGGLGVMYAGRALTGIGVGGSAMVVPIYIAECSPPSIRGRCIGIFEIMLQLASLCGFWVNYGVNQNLKPSLLQWRIPFAVQLIPSGLLILTMLFAIESPRWLVKNGKHERALKNLSWVRNLPADHPYIQNEISEINAQLDAEAAYGRGRNKWIMGFRELFSKGNRYKLFLAVMMKVCQNFAGVNALNYYSPLIFKSIGFTGTSTGLLATGVYGIIKTVFTGVFVYWLVDSWGRRPALLTGGSISLVAMFYLGGYSAVSGSFSPDVTPPKDAGAYFAIIFIYIYAASYAFSWNAIPWIFAAEIFPTNIRGLAMLIVVCVQWLTQFIIIYSVPYMIKNIRYGIFILFGTCILLSSIFVYFFIPETKSFPLEKSHLIFESTIWAPKARKLAEQRLAEERADGTTLSTGLEKQREEGDDITKTLAVHQDENV